MVAITTFQGERSISAIADRLYVGLTDTQRKKVEAVLLRANPHLAKIKDVQAGAILQVPDIPELRPKLDPNNEQPTAQVASNLSDALNAYDKHLAERFAASEVTTRTQLALLKSAGFKRAVADTKNVKNVAGSAASALQARSEADSKQKSAAQAAIEQALGDLKEITG